MRRGDRFLFTFFRSFSENAIVKVLTSFAEIVTRIQHWHFIYIHSVYWFPRFYEWFRTLTYVCLYSCAGFNALQQLIIQKAADDLRQQKEVEAAEKTHIIESRVTKLEISGLKKGTKPILLVLPLWFMKYGIFYARTWIMWQQDRPLLHRVSKKKLCQR